MDDLMFSVGGGYAQSKIVDETEETRTGGNIAFEFTLKKHHESNFRYGIVMTSLGSSQSNGDDYNTGVTSYGLIAEFGF